jgi:hypothetical protein
LIAAALAEAGIDQIFMELDMWIRRPLLPILTETLRLGTFWHHRSEKIDMQITGHVNCPGCWNIGFYRVFASDKTAQFFKDLHTVLLPSKDSKEYLCKNKWEPEGKMQRWFDQGALFVL